MYGDPDGIRRLATRMDNRAVDLRAQATTLVAGAEKTLWLSDAGGRMRERAVDRSLELRSTAASYEDAAEKLRHHAREVEELIALIAEIEEKVSNLIAGAVDRLKDAAGAIVEGAKDLVGAGDEPDPADERLAHYSTPPSGDKAWLDVPDALGVRI